MPRAILSEKTVSLELLQTYLDVFEVTQAKEAYELLVKANEVTIDTKVKLDLLELLCYYCEEEAMPENYLEYETDDAFPERKWKPGCLAEKVRM